VFIWISQEFRGETAAVKRQEEMKPQILILLKKNSAISSVLQGKERYLRLSS
jgi:hypothetical protein